MRGRCRLGKAQLKSVPLTSLSHFSLFSVAITNSQDWKFIKQRDLFIYFIVWKLKKTLAGFGEGLTMHFNIVDNITCSLGQAWRHTPLIPSFSRQR